ncbi:MAG: iron-containing redox enzyme family protein [Gammaproteobacteria bacterium]|jgi:pyrroloquinoline quinone (PQQ) biosynthesis protein C|nr:iron-containing redox enzyme family protein [Gammaproteobacteria bacterium]MBT4606870.1 iron-containing redox enzyme family protein [Thiotrichales bacterium]MBT3473349.1 iron-containing redox enzyme family protein [Gammaproteobacteria bacterium]MBT3967403.1 iron-containing redox enzyme family protein [Gammaproteobacteria bacterium]MBT4080764.1 iron-containing redox enzyme family protein [Gammaproteobacteria bacterium]
MSTFYQRLLQETEQERNAFLSIPLLHQAVAGELSEELYLSFLKQAYHHVKHTTPLLMACGSQLPERLEWLREAVGEYIEEEMGHQEWILNDIAALGEDKEAVRYGTPNIETELMVSYAWDTIQRRNPVGFFGMVLVLEGTSVELAVRAADAIETTLELPKEAFSYLRSHGSLDIEHVDFYERLMNRLELVEDQNAIIHCAKVMYRLYGGIFRSLS